VVKYGPAQHHRRSIRLPAYDYAQAGAYFVTLVSHARECLFGQVIDGEMRLNALGEVVVEEWRRTGEIRREVEPDILVVMPNHIHGIVIVGAHGRAPLHRAPLHRSPRSVGSFVAGFKSAVTKRINEMRGTPGLPLWQRNYYEHIIRNEEDLNHVRQYVVDNPARWEHDEENPAYQQRRT
jgi:putative transposase